MKYTVVWKPAAEQELAQVWLEATDRAAITAAVREIDRLLQATPAEQGESRSSTMRVLFTPPLGVFFHVNEPDRIVCVVKVWVVT